MFPGKHLVGACVRPFLVHEARCHVKARSSACRRQVRRPGPSGFVPALSFCLLPWPSTTSLSGLCVAEWQTRTVSHLSRADVRFGHGFV